MRAAWVALVLAACAPAPPIPPIPSHIDTVIGRVVVVRVVRPAVDGDPVLGVWYWSARRIVIAADLPPLVAWHTLYHEACHIAYDAAGLTVLVSEAMQEATCDAIATARMRERFG